MKDSEGKSAGHKHRRIHHAAKVYVMGDIHTNSVEGFWSLIKRGIGGVYHSVSKKYFADLLERVQLSLQPTGSGEPDLQVDLV